MEQWKTVAESNGLYEVSNTGKLRNTSTKREKQISRDREGYVRYMLNINSKQCMRYAHRLVAQAFLPNPEGHKVVHHMNNTRDDNNVENLEWCSQKHNRAFAYVTCPCCNTKIKV